MTPAPEQRVTSTPGVCGGKPCIAGTRIRVWDIPVKTNAGETPQQILDDYPSLCLADIGAAMAYYRDHRELIEAQIAEDDRFVEQLKAAKK